MPQPPQTPQTLPTPTNTLHQDDADYCWHPFTQAKTAKQALALVRGENEFLYDQNGNKYFDAVSSWWVNIHGHCNPHIAGAIAHQAHTMEHVMFAGITHPPAVELAKRLIAKAPKSMGKVFYSDNGSTAIEVALKMAFQYWNNKAEPRKGLIALRGGYHGDTFGAMSAGRSSGFYDPFTPWLFDVDFIDTGVCACTEDAALAQLQNLLDKAPGHYAAVILEPLVQGASGMIMMRPDHVSKIASTCRQAGMLVIYDEVMTGFGRTGTLFASEQLTEAGQPDMICISKGLTGGFMPMAATLATDAIYNAFWSDDVNKALLHGHSYTANPLGCAAALASLELFDDPRTWQQIQMLEDTHRKWLPTLACHPCLNNPRVQGTIAAFEFKSQNAAYGSSNSQWIREAFLEHGILVRPLGNTMYWIPPYCTSENTLNWAYEVLLKVLEDWKSKENSNNSEAKPINTELF
ncbi:MAG: adenosylmethionine--8-amino-7-oxononanoate transaminase [Limnobacter sp.]|nr:adenosylmethionine--8-amino-7-oxononanoate transaminase [Limnobacter sp.]